MSKNKPTYTIAELRQKYKKEGNALVIEKTEVVINVSVMTDILIIGSKITFTEPVNAQHCYINKSLTPSYAGTEKYYNIEGETKLSEHVQFLGGFFCPDVNFIE